MFAFVRKGHRTPQTKANKTKRTEHGRTPPNNTEHFKTMKKETTTPTAYHTSIQGNGNVSVGGVGGNNTVNDTAIILRFLDIIESQGKEIARLHDEILRLSATQKTIEP